MTATFQIHILGQRDKDSPLDHARHVIGSQQMLREVEIDHRQSSKAADRIDIAEPFASHRPTREFAGPHHVRGFETRSRSHAAFA